MSELPPRSYTLPSLAEQLDPLPWPDIVHYAYWLGVRRARIAEFDREARYAADPTQAIARRDASVKAADALLEKLKVAILDAGNRATGDEP